MEPDTDMDYYDDEGGLPSVDDLTVVAEIAEAELRQLEKIQAAGARARELRQRLESKQRNTGAEEAAHKNCEDGTPAAKKVWRLVKHAQNLSGSNTPQALPATRGLQRPQLQ